MAITEGAVVAVSGATGTDTSVTSASFDSTGGGGMLFFVAHEGAPTTYTWSDNKSTSGSNFVTLNTIDCVANAGAGDMSLSAIFCYTPNVGTGHTVTVTFGATRPFRYIGGVVLNGSFSSSFLAATSLEAETGSPVGVNAGDLITDAAAYLFQCAVNYNGVALSAGGTGWTIKSNATGGRHFQARNESSSGTFAADYTLASNPLSNLTIAAAIKETAGGGGNYATAWLRA